MKFGTKLSYECVAEWKHKYINYSALKKILKRSLPPKPKKTTPPPKIPINVSRDGNVNNSPVSPTPPRAIFARPRLASPIPSPRTYYAHPSLAASPTDTTPFLSAPPLSLASSTSTSSYSSFNSRPASPVLISVNESVISEFDEKLESEFIRIEEFFNIKVDEARTFWNRILDISEQTLSEDPPRESRLSVLRKAFREYYSGLFMLQNFVDLNHEGFRKILKKHDKVTGKTTKDAYMANKVETSAFFTTDLKGMKEDAEGYFTDIFQIEKKSAARAELHPTSSSKPHYHLFKLGMALGFAFAMFIMIATLFIGRADVPDVHWRKFISVIPAYRAVLIPIYALWLFGFNIYIFERWRINWVFIFNLDPRTSICHRRIFKTASALTCVWLFSFFFFVGTIMGNFSFFGVAPEYFPLILIFFCLALLIFPARVFHRKARLTLLFTTFNVIIAPFGSVKFRHTYLGDVLTSMVKFLFDLEYSTCYIVTGDWHDFVSARCQQATTVALPVMSGLPLLWRFMQCLRRFYDTRQHIHLGNSMKYFVAFSTVLFSALYGNFSTYPLPWTWRRDIWFVMFIIATLYNFLWDVFVDWHLFRTRGTFLRPRAQLLFYPYVWVYYVAIVFDFLLRFAWTLTITPVQFNIGIDPEFFTTILVIVELTRRFMWSIFRVELEHVLNCGEARSWDTNALLLDLPAGESPEATGTYIITNLGSFLPSLSSLSFLPEFTTKGRQPPPGGMNVNLSPNMERTTRPLMSSPPSRLSRSIRSEEEDDLDDEVKGLLRKI
eukprot:TRINITY_DN5091_c0_g1_i2.p1 TRINITY_DN5091_c0_g1~~TRINITY_DN5091_c0_g1_i2.p1  ORF type:complete len:778 (+),score=160.04 TRINITY_DN5091_c0_g1_i2:66-2399(+)